MQDMQKHPTNNHEEEKEGVIDEKIHCKPRTWSQSMGCDVFCIQSADLLPLVSGGFYTMMDEFLKRIVAMF